MQKSTRSGPTWGVWTVCAGLVLAALPVRAWSAPQRVGGALSSVAERPRVGDPAPALGPHVEWLRGGPVEAFEPGRVYLIDFWATWCLSCVARMPHLSGLAREHADDGLEVLGLAVLHPESGMSPAAFLGMKPGSMEYPVASEREYGAVPRLLQGPSEEGAVPFLVIVDREGRIAWRSDPRDPYSGLEPALRAVLDGTWDIAAAARADRRRELAERQAAPLLESLAELSRVDDREAVVAALQELVALNADVFGSQIAELFRLESSQGRDAAFAHLAERVASIAGNPAALLAVARAVAAAAPATGTERALVISLAAAASALKAGADPDYDWALAKLQYGVGDPAGAAATMQRAIATAQHQGWDSSVMTMMRREATRYAAAVDR